MTDKPPIRLESLDRDKDGRRFSPSAGRNRQDVVDALVKELPHRGLCLEVAAGTGEHAVQAATMLPEWTWQPTDRDPVALASIGAWVVHAALPNLKAPLALDVGETWFCAPDSLDAVFASNVMHISPMATTEALFRGAAKHLKETGSLLVYGPVFLSGESRSEGNVAFDRELRDQDPDYGVRDLAELREVAMRAGFSALTVRKMPTSNVLLRFQRS